VERRAFMGLLTGGLLAAPLAAEAAAAVHHLDWKWTGDLEARQLRPVWPAVVRK